MPRVGKTKGSIAKVNKRQKRVLKRKWNKHMQAKWGDLLNSRGIRVCSYVLVILQVHR